MALQDNGALGPVGAGRRKLPFTLQRARRGPTYPRHERTVIRAAHGAELQLERGRILARRKPRVERDAGHLGPRRRVKQAAQIHGVVGSKAYPMDVGTNIREGISRNLDRATFRIRAGDVRRVGLDEHDTGLPVTDESGGWPDHRRRALGSECARK